MRITVLSLGAALALVAPVPALSGDASPAPPDGAPITVHIKNFAFVPASVTVAPGRSVRFVEDDETPHTVTAADGTFDSGELDRGATWTHVFAKEGSYAYVCTYHPYMKGTVVVK